MISARAPTLRSSQRQVTVYLEADLDLAVRRAAEVGRLTLQEILGNAINAELEARGIQGFLTVRRQHLFVRRQRAAVPRAAGATAPARLGRKCLAGWFERNEVERLAALCRETGTSIQEIAETGLRKMTSAPGADDT